MKYLLCSDLSVQIYWCLNLKTTLKGAAELGQAHLCVVFLKLEVYRRSRDALGKRNFQVKYLAQYFSKCP